MTNPSLTSERIESTVVTGKLKINKRSAPQKLDRNSAVRKRTHS